MFSALKDTVYINPYQAHRLVTHEDGHFFHAHKIFGILGLGNYVYRIASHALYGTMFYDTSFWTLAMIAIHAMMHVTSFQFLIPARRNRVYNIIWPEMRWHSLVFAYRSLFMMTVLWFAWIGVIPSYVTPWIRGPLVLATMALADNITSYYTRMDAIKETETTMRSNPYPSYVNPSWTRWYNLMYSTSQVFGTMNILCRDMGSIFLVVLPIQIAPFGMTLVKKGVITQAGWHLWYSFAIFANYWYATTMQRSNTDGLETFYTMGVLMFALGRFKFRENKYALWGSIIAAQWYLFLHRPDFFAAIESHAIP
jgi:hypothetical protein